MPLARRRLVVWHWPPNVAGALLGPSAAAVLLRWRWFWMISLQVEVSQGLSCCVSCVSVHPQDLGQKRQIHEICLTLPYHGIIHIGSCTRY